MFRLDRVTDDLDTVERLLSERTARGLGPTRIWARSSIVALQSRSAATARQVAAYLAFEDGLIVQSAIAHALGLRSRGGVSSLVARCRAAIAANSEFRELVAACRSRMRRRPPPPSPPPGEFTYPFLRRRRAPCRVRKSRARGRLDTLHSAVRPRRESAARQSLRRTILSSYPRQPPATRLSFRCYSPNASLETPRLKTWP